MKALKVWENVHSQITVKQKFNLGDMTKTKNGIDWEMTFC